MTEQVFNQIPTVSLEEAADLIAANPTVYYMLRGEPGIGKSSLALTLMQRTGYPLSMMDVPNLDLGDVAMPVIDHENKVTRYYPNARFKLHEGNPTIVMLDEFTKGADAVKNMLHPMLEVFRPRLGDLSVPEGTLVTLTGNLDSDGVGDGLAQHTRQRIVELIIRKPDATEWLRWAANNNIAAVLMAWVDRYRYCLASYLDGVTNEFNFNPAEPQSNVVSPRTLEQASRQILTREHVSKNALRAALTGTVGASAAVSILSFIEFQDKLPSLKDILDKPATAEIPDDEGARAVLTFNLLEHVQKDTLTNIMEYLRRDEMDEEWQVIFGVCLARHDTKKQIAFGNAAFAKWARDNEDLL
tara:strand:+ start:377 stop:1447 length:1071 start_codon:yes stop_codon:yes gene_type:complete